MPAPFSRPFVPSVADVPPDVDIHTVLTEVGSDHVYDGTPVDRQSLRKVVLQARSKGIDLSVVVLPANPPEHGDLRDVATVVAAHEHGTVLVLSPDDAGTYSRAYTRVRLENAEDAAKVPHGQPVVSAQAFVDRLAKEPTLSWTAVSSVMLAGTVVVVALLYWVKARRTGTGV